MKLTNYLKIAKIYDILYLEVVSFFGDDSSSSNKDTASFFAC
ncbi:hypothetical protein PRVXT_001945 [Proteinivorax tanatarense]|uniref:Uncharacterized protein n=1 Tax=Proteinivorax tanatarense TaxID=1260629 RepID=A0AAU7VIQ4_9FIRM